MQLRFDLIAAEQRLVQLIYALKNFGQVVVGKTGAHVQWPIC